MRQALDVPHQPADLWTSLAACLDVEVDLSDIDGGLEGRDARLVQLLTLRLGLISSVDVK